MKFNKNIVLSVFIVVTSIFWSKINHTVVEQSFSVGFPYNFTFYHSTTTPLNRLQFLNPLLFPHKLEIQIFTFIIDICIVYFIIYFLMFIKKFVPLAKQNK